MAFRKTTKGRKSVTAKRNASRRTMTGRTTTRRSATRRGATVRVKVWTPSEVSALRKSYRNTTNTKIAKSLGRTIASVRAKAGSLNLKKNKNFLSMVAKTAGMGGFNKTRKSPARKASSRASMPRKSSARRTTRRTSTMKRRTMRRR